jgi:hypothetical protein
MQLISFIKVSLLTGGILFFSCLSAQELYVFSEPASNMPSHSVSAKLSGKFVKGMNAGQFRQRYSPEVMLGLNKSWMLHGAATFSDMYTSNLRWESARVYAKYRFLSLDEVHRHFRMAAFAEFAHSVNDVHFDELSLEGDQSGMQGGVILTQLWNKLAVSSTLSYINVTSKEPKSFPGDFPNQAFNYSLSAGYLVLPVSYTSFKQTNLNIYAELLGQRALDMRRYSVDLAPAVQLIFNSNAKLNVGYRFQLNGNMNRMAEQGWLVSFERTFLNALKK